MHLVTITLGFAAILLYVLGLGTGSTALFSMAILLEVAFWVRRNETKKTRRG